LKFFELVKVINKKVFKNSIMRLKGNMTIMYFIFLNLRFWAWELISNANMFINIKIDKNEFFNEKKFNKPK